MLLHTQRILTLLLLLLIMLNSAFTQTFDFGDAPDPPYPTTMINGGAHHMISPLFLGSRIDGEGNGIPGTQAGGDDYSGGPDDEDGVSFTTWLLPGQNATIVVTASAPGLLDAWIDFQPGSTPNPDWTSAGDQIFTNTMLTAGQNTLNFAVPASATPGLTYARFRLSSTGGLNPSGISIDGEVEDYQVLIGLPSAGNIVLDPDPGLSFVQNELSMTIIPGTGRLVCAYNDLAYPGGPGIGVSYSSDNGISWTAQNLALPPSSTSCGGVNWIDAFDPSITVDNSGNLYLAHISTDYNWNSGPISSLYVHKSTDGGVSWGTPYPVDIACGASGSPDINYRFNDRCQITVDRTSGSYAGNIYLAWIQDRGWNVNPAAPPSDIYISYSTDAGASFSTAKRINALTNSLANMPIPAVAANGDVYILWMHYNVITGGTGTMYLNKSTDGGINWGSEVAVGSPINLPPINLNGGSDARAKGAAILKTHPTNSNILYIVYAASTGVDEGDIYFIKSTDGGSNWSSPLKINDDGTTNDQVLPWMEVTPNGIISVAWYDRRNSLTDLSWDVYSSTSTDEGNSFATNAIINTTSFTTPSTPFGSWFGEYLGLASTNSTSYVGFSSSAIDSKGDVFFTHFSNPVLVPVKLLSFELQLTEKGKVKLRWETAFEINSDFFIVERSNDAINWKEISRLNGAGNSSYPIAYITLDEHPDQGINFYRLKQLDSDGKYTYSVTRSIELQNRGQVSMEIYPNPFNSEFTVELTNDKKTQVEVFDHLGKLLLSEIKEDQRIPINMSQFASGIYFIRVQNGKEIKTLKVFKR